MISGSSEGELEEIRRISDNVSALIDSERTVAGAALMKDRADFQQVCKKAGIDCHVLDRRATENYLTEAAIRKVKGPNYRSLQPFEKLKDVTPSWGKNENWRIAREMNIDDFIGTDLGLFLKSL
ncbi:MAG: hypothetical protein E6J43_13765 [Chloroflexi bacterium]|nr:MAG: hypothetical protein E6J43_13765 [Chloroflexota bacterium]